MAQKLGYLIVGLRIDPDDWKKPDAGHDHPTTLQRLADTNPDTGGQVVLLHDSGGDRSRTVAALPDLIDQLRAHGYQPGHDRRAGRHDPRPGHAADPARARSS